MHFSYGFSRASFSSNIQNILVILIKSPGIGNKSFFPKKACKINFFRIKINLCTNHFFKIPKNSIFGDGYRTWRFWAFFRLKYQNYCSILAIRNFKNRTFSDGRGRSATVGHSERTFEDVRNLRKNVRDVNSDLFKTFGDACEMINMDFTSF